MRLEEHIRSCLENREILIQSHAVVGYPSMDANREAIAAFADAGVELMELQFPFTEPTADGPVLVVANQDAVANGITIDECFEFAAETTKRHSQVGFVVMTYYNVIFCRGDEQFVRESAEAGLMGVIVPDLPPENAETFRQACDKYDIAPIFLVTPKTSTERVKLIASCCRGMVYGVARLGVTGYHTIFSEEFDRYLVRVRSATDLPVGVGFGVQTKEDIDHLASRAEVAIVCTQAVKLMVERGPQEAAKYLASLRD